ncbi:MAG: transcriptional regulator [Planctomycetota bacterium]
MSQPDPDASLIAGSARLDKLLEHRSRLTILVLLARHEEMNFRRLRDLLQETDGNLGAHLRRLEDSAYLQLRKTFEGRRPVTWYRITATGRAALTRHIEALQDLTAGFHD